ncbi:MAG: insulinase family protein [Sphingopyxis terrae]|nr:insulinase family protein [Sphingopyxis terrae]
MTRFHRFAVALAVSTSLVAAGPALAKAKEAQPAPISELVKAVDIPYQSFTLDNGLRVIVHEDHKAPVVAVSVWYRVGSKHEPAGKTGFAHLFEHLMFNGSENSPGDFFEPLQQVGATDFNGTTNTDRTNYFETVPTGALDRALFLESDRMGHLLGAVTQEKLDNQRGVVQNEKRQGDNNPYGLLRYEIFENLFPKGHPYHHSTIGSMADLNTASLADVKKWFSDNYGPNNAVLVLAGDIDLATAKTKVAEWFGDIPRGPEVKAPQTAVPTLPAPLAKEVKDLIPTTRIYRMWAIPGLNDPESVPLQMATAVLGGLSSSRLDNALVRKDPVAVSVAAFAQTLEDAGFLIVQADVKPGVDPKVVGEKLDAQIADFLATGPTADELQRAAASYLGGTISGLESVGGFGGKAVTLAEGQLYADDPEFYRRQLAALGAVTPDSVRATMQRWLTRPVVAIRVDPGEREPYAEAAAARPAPAPVEPLAITPRGPMPEVGPMKALDFPDVERARLSNGMEVVYARSSTVPVTRVVVEFDAGVAADPIDAPGTQRLMLDLLTEGTTSRNVIELAEQQERLGASIDAFATVDRTAVALGAVSANLAPSLDLLADVIRNPAFAAADLERRRAQQLSAIAQERTSPNGMGARAWPAIFYGPDHPYGRPFSGLGDPETVSALGRDDLVAFHQRWIRPDNGRVFVVSDLPLAELTPLLEARLGAWSAPTVARGTKTFDTPVPPRTPRIVLIDRPQSPQSLILGGAVLPVTGRDDLVTLNAANEVIGNGFLSRINQDIRETRGWSYGLFGRVNPLEHQTPYVIQAPVQADRTGDSIAVLIDQYRAFLSDRGVTTAERDRTVNGNVRQLPGGFETSTAVLNALRSNALYGRPDDYWETLAPRYEALTPAAMDAAARAVLDSSTFVWVVVGDASVVRPQLEALGLPVELQPAR